MQPNNSQEQSGQAVETNQNTTVQQAPVDKITPTQAANPPIQPTNASTSVANKNHNFVVPVLMGVIIVLAVIVGFLAYKSHTTTSASGVKAINSNVTTKSNSDISQAVQTSSTLSTYKTSFGVGFSYPSNWTVTNNGNEVDVADFSTSPNAPATSENGFELSIFNNSGSQFAIEPAGGTSLGTITSNGHSTYCLSGENLNKTEANAIDEVVLGTCAANAVGTQGIAGNNNNTIEVTVSSLSNGTTESYFTPSGSNYSTMKSIIESMTF